MNLVILIGRLTKDPEAKTTTSGKMVTSFNLAVDRKYKNANGENQTDFLSIVTWDKTAEFVDKYIKKGTKIAVTGEIQTRNYENKDGQKIYVTEVVARDVEFAESKKADGGMLLDVWLKWNVGQKVEVEEWVTIGKRKHHGVHLKMATI